MMKIYVLIACVFLTSTAVAGTSGCYTNAYGKTVCSDGNGGVIGYNPNTGNTAGYNKNTGDRAVNINNSQRIETNQNGVTTIKGRRGGEAKTKNGMGVVHGPNGKTCVRTRHNQGCN